MRPTWRLASLRVLARQLQTARATWQERWRAFWRATSPWRARWLDWYTPRRRPLWTFAALGLLLMALILYDRSVPLQAARDAEHKLLPPQPWETTFWPPADETPQADDDAQAAAGGGNGQARDGGDGTAGALPSDPYAASDAGASLYLLQQATEASVTAAARAEMMLAPVEGETVAAFGFAASVAYGDFRFHPGIDIAAAAGTPVQAAYSGRVREAGYTEPWGWRVTVDLGDGRTAVYANLAEIYVKAGMVVQQGDTLGTVGQSATAESGTAPHVHFELRRGEEAIAPAF